MPVTAVDFEPTTSTDSVTLAAGDFPTSKMLNGKVCFAFLQPFSRYKDTLRGLAAHPRSTICGNICAGLSIEAGILRATVTYP